MTRTRSRDVDLFLVAFLAEAAWLEVAQVTKQLEKHSGLLAASSNSLDTRVRMRDYYSSEYVRLAFVAFLAVLGCADAVIFAGGIAGNTPFVRQHICEGLRRCGLQMNRDRNRSLVDTEGLLSTENYQGRRDSR
jgi:acetate kinase